MGWDKPPPSTALIHAYLALFMSDHIYKKIELVGSSPDSIEMAVRNAVETAAKTVRNLRWFEVTEIRGHIDKQKVAHWQVGVKIGFTIEVGGTSHPQAV
jgi:dodecin